MHVRLRRLIPTLTDEQARAIEESHARIARGLSTEELQARAKSAKKQPSVRTAQVSAYVRDAAVAEYAKRAAKGLCDLCETCLACPETSFRTY
jgi:5-methylcytosine-specific restriction protein A